MKRETRWLVKIIVTTASCPAWAVSLAPTGPAQPLPEPGVATVSLPLAENLAAGSAALVPLMAAESQSSEASSLDTAPTGGGDLGKPVDDLSFLALAADRGRRELGAAHEALAQLDDPELKRIAAALVRDHDATNAQMEKLAAAKHWPLPDVPPRPAPPAGTAQADFDALWTDETISAHERLAALYAAQAQGGEDLDVRRFARDTLPVLQRHLAELRRLQK